MATRDPDSPADLSRRSRLAVLKRARVEYGNDNVSDLAAALTYYAVMAVVPGLIVLLSVIGLTGANSQQLTTQVTSVAPGSAGKIIDTLIRQAQQHHGG